MITYTVSPLRLTPDPAAMVAFYELCGLRTSIAADSGGYLLLAGAAGNVAVHTDDTPRSGAMLSLMGPSAAEVEADLRARGLDPDRVDEAYGEEVLLPTPWGEQLWIGEPQHDLYGYRTEPVETPPTAGVTAVWFTPDFARDRAFFGALGFATDGEPAPGWEALTAGPSSGRIGLHAPQGRDNVCAISLDTSEPLAAVRDRLRAAGHAAEIDTAQGFPILMATDPDGVSLQVHGAA